MSADDKIGVSPLVVLAPMSGVTDVAMRRIAARFGASFVVSEMVASDELARGSVEASLRAQGQGLAHHVVQLAGCDANWMAEAARIAENNGATQIDINMGCPAKRVTGGWSGSALMRDVDHATSLMAATKAATSLPVSVKMRLGWDEASINAPELARRADDIGLSMVTVHGRTRQQFYKGQADWRAIAPVRHAFSGVLLANGDISNAQDARDCLAQSSADGVMIGRAAMGRPWLLGQIAVQLDGQAVWSDPAPNEKATAAIEHYEALLSLYGRDVGLRHARKHLAAYADEAARDGSSAVARLREPMLISLDDRQVVAWLQEMFAAAIPERAHAA